MRLAFRQEGSVYRIILRRAIHRVILGLRAPSQAQDDKKGYNNWVDGFFLQARNKASNFRSG